MERIVIIGGGIAGLATALRLKELMGEKIHVTVLEMRDRVGGNIVTERKEGFLIEGGPDCFLSEKPWAMELCRKLDMEDELLPTNEENQKTFVLSGGILHELPEGVILMVPTKILPLLRSKLISFSGKMRMACEPFIPRKKTIDDESLAEFVKRRLGKEVLEKIAEPLVAGIHAGVPETMSVRSSFPKFVQLEQEYRSLVLGMLARKRELKKKAKVEKGEGKRTTMFMTIRGGLYRLIEAITSALEGFENISIRTGIRVRRISKKDDGYEVEIDGAPSVEGDVVVVAAPAYTAGELLKDTDRELTDKLLSIPYVSTATVSLGFKKADVGHDLRGFGFVVPRLEKRSIMAATWSSSKFMHRSPGDSVLIRCFVGGAKNEKILEKSDVDIVLMVRDELRDIMGIEAEPVITRVFKWHRAMPQYTIGHDERIDWIEKRLLSHPGLYLTGSAYRGIGISDCIRNGEITAKRIVDYLSKRH